MSDFAVRVENISKRYRIGQREPYKTLRDTLTDTLAAPFRPRRSGAKAADNFIWALRDVSLEIKHGEAVGIIGRNGAGKSTLLKILSRITEPTTGRVLFKGRVGSLLEVGTGFNPELTGRENIYLNGAILGMRRREIERKFDEIIAFSELDRFIDTPVKHYSTGMYMRLAFSVAAHLEPEILVVDEVLAVGDAQFQKKCLGKMGDVTQQGRTVLFVSHNMPAITTLCSRGILLQQGSLTLDGTAQEAVGKYLMDDRASLAEKHWLTANAPGNDIVRLRAVRVRTQNGEVRETFDIQQPVGVEMEYDVLQPEHILVPHFHFFTESGILAFITGEQSSEWRRRPRPMGHFVSTAWVPGNFLAEGSLFIGATIITPRPKRVHFFEQSVLNFQVIDNLDGNTTRGDFAGHFPGVIRPLLEWTTRFSIDKQLIGHLE